jgi:hypothetical protein
VKKTLLLAILIECLACFSQEEKQPILWAHTLDGYNTTDFADMDVDSSGNSFVSILYQGEFSDPKLSTKLPEPGYVGGGIVKFDPSGKPLWVIGIKAAWSAWTRSLLVAKNGDFLITGSCEGITTFQSASGAVKKVGRSKDQGAYHHPQFLFLARYTNNGELLWVKVLETSGFGVGTSIAETSRGELRWSIHFNGKLKDGETMIDEAITNDSQLYKYDILKLTDKGIIKGIHPFQRFSFDENPLYNARLVIDREDALIIHGLFQKSVRFTSEDSLTNDNYYDSRDAFIVKFDRSDTYVWSKKVGGQHYQEITEMRADKRGNIHITGHYGYECILSNGVELIQKTKFEYKSGYSFFYCSFSKDGVLEHAQFESQPGYGGTVMGRAMGLDENGYAHIFGSFIDTLSFGGRMQPIRGQHDPNSVFYSRWKQDTIQVLTQPIVSNKGWGNFMDVVIRNGKILVGGIYYGRNEIPNVNGKSFVFTERDYGRSAFIYSFSVPELPSIYDETDSIEPILAIAPVLACLPPQLLDQPNMWVLKGEPRSPNLPSNPELSGDTGCGIIREDVRAILVPNPTSDLTALKITGGSGKATIRVFSPEGQVLFVQDVFIESSEQSFELNFSHVAPGSYYIQLENGEYEKLLKLIKM